MSNWLFKKMKIIISIIDFCAIAPENILKQSIYV